MLIGRCSVFCRCRRDQPTVNRPFCLELARTQVQPWFALELADA